MATAAPTAEKQSRTGKRPVPVPKGVQVAIAGNDVTLKGPKGELKRKLHAAVKVEEGKAGLVVTPREGTGRDGTQYQGLGRALLSSAIQGVAEGYKVSLDLYGVGYRADLKGQSLTLGLGLSHQVKLDLPKGVAGRVETIDEAGTKRPRLHLESNDKDLLGLTAARIRSFRPPEPYKGKGVRYTGEVVKQKAGKAASKGK